MKIKFLAGIFFLMVTALLTSCNKKTCHCNAYDQYHVLTQHELVEILDRNLEQCESIVQSGGRKQEEQGVIITCFYN